jgi:hypothetical protein
LERAISRGWRIDTAQGYVQRRLRRKAGVAAIIAMQPSLMRCGDRRTLPALLHSKRPIVANPSSAAYTWFPVGVEVPINASFEPEPFS